ncbi:hypothetical protein CRG98_046763 [Punica granatum]|uniref:Uncharacterized protein n=1 Tax=Punica granatum TaxID=22663 RepID=A0A2I0HMC4_PUNGR|nr:hypothetical protein CRG98_046763 [Punica granatum]
MTTFANKGDTDSFSQPDLSSGPSKTRSRAVGWIQEVDRRNNYRPAGKDDLCSWQKTFEGEAHQWGGKEGRAAPDTFDEDQTCPDASVTIEEGQV